MKKVIKTLAVTTLSVALTLPITAYANQWTQDNTGWKVKTDEGVYLYNQWYQSPESKLWYYIGSDGYMLVDTTTPDGYTVNFDGVWIEQPVPEQELAPGALSEEEIYRREEEAGIGHNAEGSILEGSIHLDKEAGKGYDWR